MWKKPESEVPKISLKPKLLNRQQVQSLKKRSELSRKKENGKRKKRSKELLHLKKRLTFLARLLHKIRKNTACKISGNIILKMETFFILGALFVNISLVIFYMHTLKDAE
ncbi:hypothetical protein X975_04273, partial [Stegodyphus mimosarum]